MFCFGTLGDERERGLEGVRQSASINRGGKDSFRGMVIVTRRSDEAVNRIAFALISLPEIT